MGKFAVVTNITNADATLGAMGLTAIVLTGSAVTANITFSDGADAKFVLRNVLTTTLAIAFSTPVAFQNMIVDNSGTGRYSLTFVPVG